MTTAGIWLLAGSFVLGWMAAVYPRLVRAAKAQWAAMEEAAGQEPH